MLLHFQGNVTTWFGFFILRFLFSPTLLIFWCVFPCDFQNGFPVWLHFDLINWVTTKDGELEGEFPNLSVF